MYLTGVRLAVKVSGSERPSGSIATFVGAAGFAKEAAFDCTDPGRAHRAANQMILVGTAAIGATR